MGSDTFELGKVEAPASTWEEAARRASSWLWNRYEAQPSEVNAVVVTSRFFDGIAEEAFGREHNHQTWLIDRFANLGARALWGANLSTIEIGPHLQDVVELIASKQADYGHGNILRFGIDGIIVRLSDKLARLENLTRTGKSARNEALSDTWNDIVGYSIIAIMLLKGTFELPLAADLHEEIRAGLSK